MQDFSETMRLQTQALEKAQKPYIAYVHDHGRMVVELGNYEKKHPWRKDCYLLMNTLAPGFLRSLNVILRKLPSPSLIQFNLDPLPPEDRESVILRVPVIVKIQRR